jgi:hypothetical protein
MQWQKHILDALESLDRSEGPHGLYGIRQAHAVNGRIPKLAHLLSSGETSIFKANELRSIQSRFRTDHLSFFSRYENEHVVLTARDFATTKVRKFGSEYRVDDHQRKSATNTALDLETSIPKLSKKRCRDCIYGILLIAHYQQSKEIEPLLGRSTEPDFLARYQVCHFVRKWIDRYHRNFQTALHLWSSLSDRPDP